MKIGTNFLIKDLLQICNDNFDIVSKFKLNQLDILNKKKDEQSWSALECLSHLNLYGDFYLPEIRKSIENGKISDEEAIFKSGILGNYFANMMIVKDGEIKKMKSPKDKIPSKSILDEATITDFLLQMETLISFLNKAKKIDLNKTKTAISISSFIKLKLGDTFRFYIYHQQRHIQQALRAVQLNS